MNEALVLVREGAWGNCEREHDRGSGSGSVMGITEMATGEEERIARVERWLRAVEEDREEKLTTAEEEFETCRDDLFRPQPVCQISDASIIDAFESLGEQIGSWIDDQASAFECVNLEEDVDYLFSNGKDLEVTYYRPRYPSAGEYICRHIVDLYLLERTLGRNIRVFGVPAEFTRMLATIERGMGALRPPRGTRSQSLDIFTVLVFLTVTDSQRIDMWRGETLSALAATQASTDLKDEQNWQVTANLFEILSTIFPNLHGKVGASWGLHKHVTLPAMAIVSKLQGLASTLTLDMASEDSLDNGRISMKELENVRAIDLKTGKRVKQGSAIVGDLNGAIGDFFLTLEPGLRLVREGGSAIELRKGTWLVRLDDSLGTQEARMSEGSGQM